MHRRRRDRRRILAGLGFLATIAALAALVTSGIIDHSAPRPSTSDVRTQTYNGPGTAESGPPTLAESLKAGADAQVRAEAEAKAKARAEAKAKARAEAKAKAEAKAEAEAEAEARAEAEEQERLEAQREAAAEAAARSAERAASDPRSVAAAMLADHGWDDSEFSCLDELWTHESNWDHTAENPTSGAYGIPQSLPPEKMAEFGDDYLTNPVTQIEWGLAYIEERYGSPCAAWDFWQANNWY